MKREIYKVNCPKHIIFGNIMYINSKDKKSKELVAKFKSRSFEARLIFKSLCFYFHIYLTEPELIIFN